MTITNQHDLKDNMQDQQEFNQVSDDFEKKSPILTVTNLTTRFSTPEGEVEAVSNVNFSLYQGESLGVVGESGSGKTQVFMSIMGLLAKNGKTTGSVNFKGTELVGLEREKLDKIRGDQLAMIFQDPMTSLNPYLKVSRQMTEVLIEHKKMSMADARAQAIKMLDLVGIPDVKGRFDLYPHEFSGGMRQRVMIAMSLLCEPEILIADEPTTALDVTIQAQILDVLNDIKKELNTAIVMITHDLGVVAGICDHVMVMYGGRVVEKSPVEDLFYRPQHPYTKGLLSSMPRLTQEKGEALFIIPGQPPNLQRLPKGCAFAPRCFKASPTCEADIPELAKRGRQRTVACFSPIEVTH